jgi:hypothetical protein
MLSVVEASPEKKLNYILANAHFQRALNSQSFITIKSLGYFCALVLKRAQTRFVLFSSKLFIFFENYSIISLIFKHEKSLPTYRYFIFYHFSKSHGAKQT